MTTPTLVHLVSDHPELSTLAQLLRRAFTGAGAGDGDPARSNRVTRIVLFAPGGDLCGVLARPGAPLDLLVLTDHHEFDDTYAFQDAAERRLRTVAHRCAAVLPPIHLSVHALGDANRQLAAGSRLLARVLAQGVVLDERPGALVEPPADLSPEQVYCEASAQNYACRDVAANFLGRATAEAPRSRRKAAFLLHQAAEQAYARILRVLAFYAPRTHDLGTLRRLAEPLAPELADLWRDAGARPESFAKLQAAYGHRRAARGWSIEEDDLDEMTRGVEALLAGVDAVCRDTLAAVEALANADQDIEGPQVWRA
jgi:HEPN domain-containing protein